MGSRQAVGALGRVTRAAGWGVVDQGLSSLTNFALTLLAARSLEPPMFGGFTLAFAAYLVALGLARSAASEPLAVRASGGTEGEWKEAAGSATGAAVLVGAVGGALMVLAGALAGGPVAGALIAIGACLPGLLLQDAWRFAFFAASRAAAAAANDAVWSGALAILLVIVGFVGRPSPTAFALAWGLSGTLAGIAGIRQAGLVPRPAQVRVWLARHSDLIPRFAGQFAVSMGAGQATLYLIGALAGLAAVGAIRAAQVLLGPLNVVFMGAGLVGVPEAARHARAGGRAVVRRIGILISGALGAAVVTWAIVVTFLPGRVGSAILGENWVVGRPLLVPVAAAMSGSATLMGAAIILRGLAAAGRSLRAAAAQGSLTVAFAGIGAAAAGARGAAWGLAIAMWIASSLWWTSAVRALREVAERVANGGETGSPAAGLQ